MFNDIHIGPLTIHMYGLMIGIGFFTALLLCLYRSKKAKLNEDTIYGILFCAIIGGLLGCRLLFYIVDFREVIMNPSVLWNFKEGFVVYGGIIGGALASLIYIRFIRKEKFLPYFDLVMPAVAMAQGFGRIGCFCAGCCYGAETNSWFHITFAHSAYAPNGVPLIPTQLMSSGFDFLNAAFLLFLASKKPVTGRVGATYLMTYGVGRFIIEFFRSDFRGNIGPLSTSQIISIGIVALGVIMFFVVPKFQEKKEA